MYTYSYNIKSKFQLRLLTFGQTGFSSDLQETFYDEDGNLENPNNIQHHLVGIYLGYHLGAFAVIPAWLHEQEKAGTKEDFESSMRAINLGMRLRGGKVNMIDLLDLIY